MDKNTFPKINLRSSSSSNHEQFENSFYKLKNISPYSIYNDSDIISKIPHFGKLDSFEAEYAKKVSTPKPNVHQISGSSTFHLDTDQIAKLNSMPRPISSKRHHNRYHNKEQHNSLHLTNSFSNNEEPKKYPTQKRSDKNFLKITSNLRINSRLKVDSGNQDSTFINMNIKYQDPISESSKSNKNGQFSPFMNKKIKDNFQKNTSFSNSVKSSLITVNRRVLKLNPLSRDDRINESLMILTDRLKHFSCSPSSRHSREKDFSLYNDPIINLIKNDDYDEGYLKLVKKAHEAHLMPIKHYKLDKYKNSVFNMKNETQENEIFLEKNSVNSKKSNLIHSRNIGNVSNQEIIIMESKLKDFKELSTNLLRGRHHVSSNQASHNINRLKDSKDFFKLDLSILQKDGLDIASEKDNLKKFVNRINHVKDVAKIKGLHTIRDNNRRNYVKSYWLNRKQVRPSSNSLR